MLRLVRRSMPRSFRTVAGELGRAPCSHFHRRGRSATASSNPVLVEVMRGALVESRHAGAVAIADATGKLALALGDVERPIFPRSAVKVLQAIPLVKSGAADGFGLGDA